MAETREKQASSFVMISTEDLDLLAVKILDHAKKDLESAIIESNEDRLLSTKEAMAILGVNRTTLWRWDQKNYLNPIEVGGLRKYRFSDIKALMQAG